MSLFSLFFGTASSAALPDLHISVEDGFVDIDIPIQSMKKAVGGSLEVMAKGKYKQETVGFSVKLNSKWDRKPIENTDQFLYWGSGTIKGTGKESDAFSKMLAEQYKLPCTSPNFPSKISVQIVGIANDPKLATSAPTKMKIFLNSDSEANYAEVFLNIDPAAQLVEFHEKDEEYRKPLLRALCGKS